MEADFLTVKLAITVAAAIAGIAIEMPEFGELEFLLVDRGVV